MCMSMKIDRFLTSGWDFDETQELLKSRYQMANIALILSGLAFFFGIIVNFINDMPDFFVIESALIPMNVILFFILRKYKNAFEFVIGAITVQCTFLLLYIIFKSDLESMKHMWIFTYPIVLLYFQKNNNGIYWTIFLLLMLIVAPLQNIIEIKHSSFQIMYMCVVLAVVSTIVYYYQRKMTQIANVILKQQEVMRCQITQLVQKDKLLTSQSKQAVMGEMISMIAHQWRQPLSTVTLTVSNIQVKKLLGEKIDERDLDKALEDISNTVVYLSNTIDDFQKYFKSGKAATTIEAHELIKKATSFLLPRLKSTKIKIEIENQKNKEIQLRIYMNELIQVLLNILNNAIDALVLADIDNPKITIRIEEKSDTVVFNVEDNAHGIKKEDILKIFEPYYSTKGKNGTGIGLYMSQMIIEKQFNGKIDVTSSKNGSLFSIEIEKLRS